MGSGKWHHQRYDSNHLRSQRNLYQCPRCDLPVARQRKPAAETTGTNYYDEPVAWANTKQLLDGTAVPFAPVNLSPRADIVTYLYRDFAE